MTAASVDAARFAGLPSVPTEGRPLTRRQVEILLAVAGGCTDAQVGRRLGITEGSAKVMLRRVKAKLGARNRAAAVHLAWRAGILS